MIGVGLGLLANLGDALIKGDDNVISALIEKKLQTMGTDLLQQFVPMELLGTSRIQRALQTGGASEFNRARASWLNKLRPAPLPGTGYLQKFQKALDKAKINASRPGGMQLTWTGSAWGAPDVKWTRQWSATGGHWRWDRSRQEWLNRDWRYNWLSQPRDYHGRWIPGRLKSPYVSRRQKKRMRGIRRAARKAVREFYGS